MWCTGEDARLLNFLDASTANGTNLIHEAYDDKELLQDLIGTLTTCGRLIPLLQALIKRDMETTSINHLFILFAFF